MLDLETLSTRPNAYILSIGAIEFDVKTGKLGRAFYQLIDGDAWSTKFHIDPATVRWWLNQSPEARSLLSHPSRRGLPEVLVSFDNYIRECGGENCEVWGNGAEFDNAILRNAYLTFDKDAPWAFYSNRCYRTFKNLYSPVVPPAATADQAVSWGAQLPDSLPPNIFTMHSALGDSISQTRSMLSVYGHAL